MVVRDARMRFASVTLPSYARHVEIDAHENAFPFEVNILYGFLIHRCSALSTQVDKETGTQVQTFLLVYLFTSVRFL